MTSYTVLLCDASAFIRTLLRDIVGTAGYQVVAEAENGRKAVELFIATRPDVVIMDVVMPEMIGMDALREMRRVDPRARIVVAGAMGQHALVADALDAGAHGYVLKPFTASHVAETLADVVDGNRR